MFKVLLIEDNTEIKENTAELLELANFEVITAENGRTGFQMAIEILPDIILCDIMMPEVNGYEVLTQLKAHPNTVNVPFVFFTASAEPSEIKIGLQMGASGYVRKPYTEEELLDALNSCL